MSSVTTTVPQQVVNKVVVFEGSDGCGKTTLSKAVYTALSALGLRVASFREPGSCSGSDDACEDIRQLLIRQSAKKGMTSMSQLLCLLASRAELFRTIARAVETQRLDFVLLDRCYVSSIVHQVVAGDFSITFDRAMQLHQLVLGQYFNHFRALFYLDTPYSVCCTRDPMGPDVRASDTDSDKARQRIHRGYQAVFQDQATYATYGAAGSEFVRLNGCDTVEYNVERVLRVLRRAPVSDKL